MQVLLVDATNAYNSMFRHTALHNIQFICPELATYIINTYRAPSNLFLPDGSCIMSNEGTTQGDNCASGFYSVGIFPIIRKLTELNITGCVQSWFADDSAAGGKLQSLRKWWDNLLEIGPKYGYFPNSSKTYLVVKPHLFIEANNLFSGTNVIITPSGHSYLGAAIGTKIFREQFTRDKVNKWRKELLELCNIAKYEPQVCYSAFVYGLSKRWLYLMRTMDNISELFRPLEEIIKDNLIPTLFNSTNCSELDRAMYSLPAKYGGLSLLNPVEICNIEHSNSKSATRSIVDSILKQKVLLNNEELSSVARATKAAKYAIQKCKAVHYNAKQKQISDQLPTNNQRKIFGQLKDKGVSCWLTSLPLVEFGFTLSKQEFQDSLRIHYNKDLQNLPQFCACGAKNSLNHSLSCKKGGFVSLRHNQVRDLEASMLSEVCKDVVIEPQLTPLTGETFFHKTANTADEARLDISARGVWNTLDKTFFDVRIFHSQCPSNMNLELKALYNKHEKEKKRCYNARVINIEKSTFTPLVFSTAGGMGGESEAFHKRLATLLSQKRGNSYSETMSFVRRRLRFSILRSCLAAVRGYRGKSCRVEQDIDINLVPKEASYY